MLNKKNLSGRHLVIYFITLFFLLVILPIIAIKVFPKAAGIPSPEIKKIDIPKTVNLYITSSKKTITIDFEKYIQGVVASEMPQTFAKEALKAQAVASRTYAMGKILAGDTLCDSTHCQVYRSTNISSKVIKAVNSTQGQLLYYKGHLAAHTLYFASSGGKTENSEEIFSTPYGYLKSVNSPYENKATHRNETSSYKLSKFASLIKKAFPKLTFGKIEKSNIKILSRTEGGRVKDIKVGKIILSGSDIRSTLGLFSSKFTIKIKGKTISFSSSGSGHGVGMSQYGANGYAEKGYNYKEILTHYYKNTDVL